MNLTDVLMSLITLGFIALFGALAKEAWQINRLMKQVERKTKGGK